jgi:hypothetical protein
METNNPVVVGTRVVDRLGFGVIGVILQGVVGMGLFGTSRQGIKKDQVGIGGVQRFVHQNPKRKFNPTSGRRNPEQRMGTGFENCERIWIYTVGPGVVVVGTADR